MSGIKSIKRAFIAAITAGSGFTGYGMYLSHTYSLNAVGANKPDQWGADALIVATGESGRIASAYEDIRGDQILFISGANPGSRIEDTIGQIDPQPQNPRVPLENIVRMDHANNTRGNALEIKCFLQQNFPDRGDGKIHTIIVYTSYAHLGRLNLEMQRASMPDNITVRFKPIMHERDLSDQIKMYFGEAYKIAATKIGFTGMRPALRSPLPEECRSAQSQDL